MKKISSISIILGLLIVAVVIGLVLTSMFPLPKPPSIQNWTNPPSGSHHLPDLEAFYTAKTIISIINITLLIALLWIYIRIYREIKSRFAVGLILTMFALLFYAISSNPLLHLLYGFRAIGMGPFAMIPDLFATVALIVLLFLSME